MLIGGAEELLAERALGAVLAVVRSVDPEVTIEHLDSAGYERGQLAVAASPSLFGGGNVVICEHLDQLNDAFVKDLSEYLARPDQDLIVVLRHAGGQRGKGLLESIRGAGAIEVTCTPVTKDDEKVGFAVEELRRAGRRATPAAVHALVEAVGSDLRELAAACAQLAADTGAASDTQDARIEVGDVDRYFGGRVEVTAFKVADAAVAGRSGPALALLRHALATGADPVPLVAALAVKVRTLAKVSSAPRGRSADLVRELGLAPWQIDRARRELSGWTDAGLAEAILALAEADAAVKGGGRDPVFAVEKAVLRVAGARGR